MSEKYPLALPEGTVLAGKYVIEKVLGQGGFGITYQAVEYETGVKVAVKEFFPDSMATRTGNTVSSFSGERQQNFEYGKTCFLQEAETLAEFSDVPGIVHVLSYFDENGTAYFVMEFVEGQSFEEFIRNNGGRLDYETTERHLLPVMEALAMVHERGIVHRDVTPDNIFITQDGDVKLIDFGAARYSLGDKSKSLDVVLKHGFAPKEQYSRHGKQGPFTDVYSVGATFYFALTGQRPPDSIDRLEMDELVPPSRLGVAIPPLKESVILMAMGVAPENRFPNMRVFRNALMNANETPQQNNMMNGQMGMNGQMPMNNGMMNGQMGMNGQMPMNNGMMMNGQMGMNGQMPMNNGMMMNGQMGMNGQMPMNGKKQKPPKPKKNKNGMMMNDQMSMTGGMMMNGQMGMDNSQMMNGQMPAAGGEMTAPQAESDLDKTVAMIGSAPQASEANVAAPETDKTVAMSDIMAKAVDQTNDGVGKTVAAGEVTPVAEESSVGKTVGFSGGAPSLGITETAIDKVAETSSEINPEGEAKEKKKFPKWIIFVAAGVVVLGALAYGLIAHLLPLLRYNGAGKKLEACEFDEAYDAYVALGDYKDSDQKATDTLFAKADDLEKGGNRSEAKEVRKHANYRAGKSLFDEQKYEEALPYLEEAGNYEDAQDLLNAANYELGTEAFNKKNYDVAYGYFSAISKGYKDAQDQANEAKYQSAEKLYGEKDYKNAAQAYYLVKNYKDASDKYEKATYNYGIELYNAGKYKEAKAAFEKIKNYSDAEDGIVRCDYMMAEEYINNGDYKAAVDILETLDEDKVKEIFGVKLSHLIADTKEDYIREHKTSSDATTKEYLLDLMDLGNSWAMSVYKELFSTWNMQSIYITDNQNNTDQYMSEFKKGGYLSFGFYIDGPEGDYFSGYYVVTHPDGEITDPRDISYKYKGGEEFYIYWNDYAISDDGYLFVDIYDENDNWVGGASIEVIY